MNAEDDRTTPGCPKCGAGTKLTSVTPRIGSFDLPELRTYRCDACCEVVTLAENDGEA